MPSFNAGEVVVEWRANLAKLKTDNLNAEKISAKSGANAAKKYKSAFDKNLNGKGSGSKFAKDFNTGLNASRVGKKNGQKIGTELQSGLKGSFKGFNLGAVFSAANLGIKIATIAINAISSSIEKAKEKEAQFKRELEEVNTVAQESVAYLEEVDRLQDLLGNSALSAAQKVNLLGGAYESLDDRLSRIGSADRKTRLEAEAESIRKLASQIEDGEKQVVKSRNVESFLGAVAGVPIYPDTNQQEDELNTLRDKLRSSVVSYFKTLISPSQAELKEKARIDALKENIRLTNLLNIARTAGDTKAANAISDTLVLEAKRVEFANAFYDDAEGKAQKYVADLQKARNQNKLNQDQIKAVAKAEADAAATANKRMLVRKAERNEAKQLFNTSRTASEQYAATLVNLAKIEGDRELNTDAGGAETFERQRIAALVKLAQATKDAKLIFAEFDRLKKAGLITSGKEVDVIKKLNDVLGITAANEKALAEAEKERLKQEEQLLFMEERKIDRQLLLARLANDTTKIENLERQLALEQKIQELQDKGGLNKDEARNTATREIAEEDVARARGVFRSGFSDGLRAAIEGDLGSFLEQKLQDLAANMFDRAVENLADAVFDSLANIAPEFLGQITNSPGLSDSIDTVASSAAGAGAQTAGSAAAATAITTAHTTGGTTAATAIGTSMTTAGAAVAAQIAAAMASSGALGSVNGLSGNQLADKLKGLKFGGAFARGGVIGTGHYGLVGENGPELVSAGSGPIRITPLDGGLSERFKGISTRGLERRGSNQTPVSNITMNIAGVKDLSSFVKSQGTIEADMAAAMRRAQSDF